MKTYRNPTSILVYCYRNNTEREYLLLKRISQRGGFWQGITGAVEDSESILEAAKRELYEETEFKPKRINNMDFSYSFPVEEEWRHMYHPDVTKIEEHIFSAEVANGTNPQLSTYEHEDFKWVLFDEAISMLKWPNNINALKYCEAQLNS